MDPIEKLSLEQLREQLQGVRKSLEVYYLTGMGEVRTLREINLVKSLESITGYETGR